VVKIEPSIMRVQFPPDPPRSMSGRTIFSILSLIVRHISISAYVTVAVSVAGLTVTKRGLEHRGVPARTGSSNSHEVKDAANRCVVIQ